MYFYITFESLSTMVAQQVVRFTMLLSGCQIMYNFVLTLLKAVLCTSHHLDHLDCSDIALLNVTQTPRIKPSANKDVYRTKVNNLHFVPYPEQNLHPTCPFLLDIQTDTHTHTCILCESRWVLSLYMLLTELDLLALFIQLSLVMMQCSVKWDVM